jgi:transposase-like protein
MFGLSTMGDTSAENTESVDLDRLRRFKTGQTITDIANREGVTSGAVRSSIRRALRHDQLLHRSKFREIQSQQETDNEQRQKALKAHLPKVIKGVECRLNGKRTITTVNKATGEMTKHTIRDLKTVATGVRLALKLLSNC